MTIDIKEYAELKTKTERLQRESDKAAGVLESTMEKLKEDFDCSTLEETNDLLKGLEKERDKAEAKYKNGLAKFKDEYGVDLLE